MGVGVRPEPIGIAAQLLRKVHSGGGRWYGGRMPGWYREEYAVRGARITCRKNKKLNGSMR